nr:DNA/RNA helicase domain-containing protein [Frondihabitans sp. 762G35]
MTTARVIIDGTFNKSVCLDLESQLIRLLSGDGAYEVANLNLGIVDADYFDRERYRAGFEEIFAELRDEGVFTRSVAEIVNGDLYKLSPFKALTKDQEIAVELITEALLQDLEAGRESTSVIQGEPGTGKTVVAIYLQKVLADIAQGRAADEPEEESPFLEFFLPDNQELLRGLRVAFVIPQQSLRKSVQRVFSKTPGLTKATVMSPFELGKSEGHFDLVIVDEAHRLNQRANQASAAQNKDFAGINEKLFGEDDVSKTQLDWILAKSTHRILLVDPAQAVRPADLPLTEITRVTGEARSAGRYFPLMSQMRVKAGDDYVGYVRDVIGSSTDTTPRDFEGYDLRFFDDIRAMRQEIRSRDEEVGLSRLVAGYAWPWRSKKDREAVDIEIDGLGLQWNSTQVDWVASPRSPNEVGSIHTVQGYDLNYVGVIIGADLRWDAAAGATRFDRASYFDTKGKENNPKLGRSYTDADLLQYVRNIYAVLLTRGVLGTYVFVVDPELREQLRKYFPKG